MLYTTHQYTVKSVKINFLLSELSVPDRTIGRLTIEKKSDQTLFYMRYVSLCSKYSIKTLKRLTEFAEHKTHTLYSYPIHILHKATQGNASGRVWTVRSCPLVFSYLAALSLRFVSVFCTNSRVKEREGRCQTINHTSARSWLKPPPRPPMLPHFEI